ncbi:hypothetical protein [Rhizobium sp. N122]|uniref:hypothetical protein n=1 Tax=Rhizobium sp. N122 TaxID=1764272 RepID=UPI00167E3854|nr:hypothetical protein [Rhizobium sp. N122]
MIQRVHSFKRGHGRSTSRFSESMSMGDSAAPKRGASGGMHQDAPSLRACRRSIPENRFRFEQLCSPAGSGGASRPRRADARRYFFGALPCGALLAAVFIWLENVLSVFAACLSFFGLRTSRLLLICPFAMDEISSLIAMESCGLRRNRPRLSVAIDVREMNEGNPAAADHREWNENAGLNPIPGLSPGKQPYR